MLSLNLIVCRQGIRKVMIICNIASTVERNPLFYVQVSPSVSIYPYSFVACHIELFLVGEHLISWVMSATAPLVFIMASSKGKGGGGGLCWLTARTEATILTQKLHLWPCVSHSGWITISAKMDVSVCQFNRCKQQELFHFYCCSTLSLFAV